MALDDTQDISYLNQRLEGLILLGGREKICGMLRRFSDQLNSFLALDPTERWKVADVHRMVGLAAMLGFSQVETTWRRLETAKPKDSDHVLARQAAEAAITFIQGWL